MKPNPNTLLRRLLRSGEPFRELRAEIALWASDRRLARKHKAQHRKTKQTPPREGQIWLDQQGRRFFVEAVQYVPLEIRLSCTLERVGHVRLYFASVAGWDAFLEGRRLALATIDRTEDQGWTPRTYKQTGVWVMDAIQWLDAVLGIFGTFILPKVLFVWGPLALFSIVILISLYWALDGADPKE